MRKVAAAFFVSSLVIIAMGMLPAVAADLPGGQYAAPGAPVIVDACAAREQVILFDEDGAPTVPARTPYFTCVTGTTLLPGEIPPPPEYCCG